MSYQEDVSIHVLTVSKQLFNATMDLQKGEQEAHLPMQRVIAGQLG